MRFENVSILSVAHVDAPHVMTSEEIERQLAPALERHGMRPDLLRDLSGIVHTFPGGWVNTKLHPYAWHPSVVYNAALDAEDHNAVGYYLQEKWGIGSGYESTKQGTVFQIR